MPTGNPSLRLGGRRYDLTRRCLVMGVINRTPDSFSDQSATVALDCTLRRAEALVAEGADILDLGGVGTGSSAVGSEDEDLDRIVPAVEALVARFDVPVSATTGSARVLAAACAAGAVMGNDSGGFSDPEYLPTAARAGAAVVATHIGLVDGARAAGLAADQVVLNAGLDLGETAAQSAVVFRESERLASLGYPLLLSVSKRTFLGSSGDSGRARSLAVVAYGVSHGARIVRVHDVAGTVRVVRLIERILEAEEGAGA